MKKVLALTRIFHKGEHLCRHIPANTLIVFRRLHSLVFGFGTFAYAKDQASSSRDDLLRITRYHVLMTYLGLALVVFFLVFCAAAFAAGPEDGDAGPGPSKLPHAETMKGPAPTGWAGMPSLSKEQMDKMWLLEDKFHSDARTIGHELVQKQMEMEALYADPKITDAAILAKQKEITLAKQKLDDKITQLRLAQRKILTPEQLKALGARGLGFGCPEHCGRAPHGGRN